MSNTKLFAPGVSGNPNGRPKGSKNKGVIVRNELEARLAKRLERDGHKILAKAIEMALTGDKTMIRALLPYMISPLKAADGEAAHSSGGITINISPMAETKTIIEGSVDEEVQEP